MAAASDRITDSILAKALAEKHEVHVKDVKVLGKEITAGSNKGDNYACIMYKVLARSEVRGERKEDRFMFKVFPIEEHFVKLLVEVILAFQAFYGLVLTRSFSCSLAFSSPKT